MASVKGIDDFEGIMKLQRVRGNDECDGLGFTNTNSCYVRYAAVHTARGETDNARAAIGTLPAARRLPTSLYLINTPYK